MFNRRKLKELETAVKLDFQQHWRNMHSSDAGYVFPTENVQEFIAKHFVEKKRNKSEPLAKVTK